MSKYSVVFRSRDKIETGNLTGDIHFLLQPFGLDNKINKWNIKFCGLQIQDNGNQLTANAENVELRASFTTGRYAFDTNNTNEQTVAIFNNTLIDGVAANRKGIIAGRNEGTSDITAENLNNKQIRFRLFDYANNILLRQEDTNAMENEWTVYFEFTPIN